MNARRWQLLCILAGLLLARAADATTVSRNATDYDGVLTRNPFNLQPPPPEAPPPPPPPPPPSNIELTGLSTAFGRQVVYMNVKNPKGAENKAMSVGDPPDEGIEVLALNIATGEVRVRNRGTESVLSLEKNGAKPPVGPAPVAPAPVVPAIRPPGAPAVPQPGTPAMGADGMPTGIGNAPAATPGAPAVIPTRSIRVPQAAPTTTQATPQLTPEVEAQIIQMEINKMINQGGPPLPPTPLTPAQ